MNLDLKAAQAVQEIINSTTCFDLMRNSSKVNKITPCNCHNILSDNSIRDNYILSVSVLCSCRKWYFI